ncbi:MAG: zinc-dependent metalloprotease, partial [Bdellovibrionia bacterium]
RMLPGESNFEGEQEVSYAQHFDITPSADGSMGTIDYYVTRNIPDEYLEPIQLAIEGWNRYFLKMEGVGRPVMQFKGRLPEGIYIGDPRFNVINWDSRRIAGAAYESQASDPATGRQSHSLIYMPAAWLFIGGKYWENGKYWESEQTSTQKLESVSSKSLADLGGPMQAARIACMRDLREVTGAATSGRLSEDEISIFGIQLLKQTLFHEIGHSIGLGHNFKGSLNYVHGQSDSIFSTSIMDYNDFEVERQAFDGIHSWNGPLLEYDRQIVSTLYNHGKDVRETDPVLPACADEEADNELGGVDPLCIRYDIENDPTLSVITAFKRVVQETLSGDVTLAQALERVGNSLTTLEAVQAIRTEEDLTHFYEKMMKSLTGSMQFYFITAKTSLASVVTTNTKSLLMFEPGILPETYSEAEMRERAFQGVQIAISLGTLSPAVTNALERIAIKTTLSMAAAPFFQTMKEEAMMKYFGAMKDALSSVGPAFENDAAHGLPKLRELTLASLRRHSRVPYYLGDLGKDHVDYETAIISILSNATLDSTRATPERLYAALSLMTFKGRVSIGDKAIRKTRTLIVQERNKAQDNKDREVSELILKVMSIT